MQRLFSLCAALVLTLGVAPLAGAANKAFRAEATLATAVTTAVDHDIDGVKWRCEGDKCIGTADNRNSLDSLVKECRKVSAVVGSLTRYVSRGRELEGSSVSSCNKTAKA